MQNMILSAMLTFLVHILIIFQGVVCVEPEALWVPHLPWQAELCCNTPSAHPSEVQSDSQSDSGHPRGPRCDYRHATKPFRPPLLAESWACLDILCQIDVSWEKISCNLKSPSNSSNTFTDSLAMSLQHLPSDGDGDGAGVVSCVGERSVACSIALNAAGSVVMVMVNLSNADVGLPVMLGVPPAPRKPDPPVNLTHSQNMDGEVVLSWSDPQSSTGRLHHEVRYQNSQNSGWQHAEVTGEATKVSLPDLRPGVRYVAQVRCQNPALPQLWSNWSEPHNVILDKNPRTRQNHEMVSSAPRPASPTLPEPEGSAPWTALLPSPGAGKPDPPVNLTHSQNRDGEVVLSWSDPQSSTGRLHHEVRYQNSLYSGWQRAEVTGEATRVSLPDLRPGVWYVAQVRCQNPALPQLWSNWSGPHNISLDNVTYIPEKVVVRHGGEVTILCVFNDHRVNSSIFVGYRNYRDQLSQSQYTVVNDRVSQMTVRPSEGRLYDTLQCWRNSTFEVPNAQVYIQGASIDISCETNGAQNAMTCTWIDSHWTRPTFFYKWDTSCDVMEKKEEEEEEEEQRVEGAKECTSRKEEGESVSCTIEPIRLISCYKLWLEMKMKDTPVRSRPVYLSPIENVKPYPPSSVEAVVVSNRVLRLAWVRPVLPSYDLQYQVRYLPTAVRPQTAWQELGPLSVPWAEVPVSDVCRVYKAKVRCMRAHGAGYWSDWTEEVYSTVLNGSAPKQGPDFWRDLREDPAQNKTVVTLHFKKLTVAESSYCVDGFIVQHQTSEGNVTTEPIGEVSSYTFDWREEVHTVTVMAENSVGSSANNINMTLDRRSKYRCLHSFSASLVNSSCVGLSWSLLPGSRVPLSLVVEWSSPGRRQATEGGSGWARLPFTDRVFYLHGDFQSSEEYTFISHPIFADEEGESMQTKAIRGDPAAYMLLMIITFLSFVLFITLLISQNHVRKQIWKDVPNPNKCSWAQELDFRKAETMDHLFKHPEGLPAWPLLLVSETISKAVIEEKTSPSTSASVHSLSPGLDPFTGQDKAGDCLSRTPPPALCVDSAGSGSSSGSWILEDIQAPDLPTTAERSAQSSVTYATVLLSDEPDRLYKHNGGSSSSDEGNFSANNSDISRSFPGGMWDLGNSRAREFDSRRSCSFNSVEEFSETSEQEDEDLGGGMEGTEKDMYYLGMGCEEAEENEEEEGKEEEESEAMPLNKVVVGREGFSVENPLFGHGDSMFDKSREEGSVVVGGGVALYVPQFRTAASRSLIVEAQDSPLQL